MPRSGWIALGGIIAALGSEASAGARDIAAGVLLAAALAIGGATAAAALRRRAPRLADWARSTALIGAGALLIAIRVGLAPVTLPPSSSAGVPAGDGPWTGLVLTVGAPKAGAQPAVIQLDPPSALVVAATLPVFPTVVPGDRVTVSGSLRPPPVGDPYADYLARIGASATIRAAAVTILPPAGDVGQRLEGLRRSADAALRLAIPEPEAGLASGIIIGLRDRVDRDLTAAFTAVGATHVVAISGWNIAIVASTLAALAGRLARRRRMLLTAIAIAGYVVFVGPSPSVIRAAGMAGVVMTARELGRPSTAAAAIGWAVIGLLAISPAMVEDSGFRLSALATVGLIAWGTPLTERLAGPSPGRLRSWLAESLGVSLAAQLATLPVVVMSFGRLSLVSPLVNLGVVPLVAPAMGAGALALLGGILASSGMPAAIATVLGLPAWVLLSAIVGMVRAGAAVPFASLQLQPPVDALVAAMAGLAIVATARWLRRPAGPPRRDARRRPAASPAGDGRRVHPDPEDGVIARGSSRGARGRRDRGGFRRPAWSMTGAGRGLLAGLAIALVATAASASHRPDGIARLTVLDVGQGDAILVEGNRGGRLLIDGGPDPGRLLIALDEHLPPWDRRVDLAILSHPHEDHAAGLAAVLERYAVKRVLEPGMIGPGPGYAALNAELISRGIPRGTLATGDRLAVDDVRFQVLWPDPGSVPERPPDGGTGINNVSIVLLGDVEGHRILLAGDIEDQIDPTLLARGLPTVDVLKVAHHGSRTSSTGPFLAAVQPRVAIISAGRGNPYGHPAPATVARLSASGARVFRTDDDGSVTVDLGPGPIQARASGGRWTPTSRPARTAFLCGLPAPVPDLVGWLAAAGRSTGTSGGGLVEGVAAPALAPSSSARVGTVPAALVAPARPFAPGPPPASDAPHRLGYDSSRDDPRARWTDFTIAGRVGSRPGRLLLGRRRVRHRGGRRGLPRGPRALSGRRPGALADPGRSRRCRPPPR